MQSPHHTTSDLENSIKAEVHDGNASTGPLAGEGAVRTGSPFRSSGEESKAKAASGFDPSHNGSASFELGIAASTALGGLLAAYCILPFAAASAIAFPAGAVLISGLGLVLAIFALAAQKPIMTTIALILHTCIGALGYMQLL